MKPLSRVLGIILMALFAFILGYQTGVKTPAPEGGIDPKKIDFANVNESITFFKGLLEKKINVLLLEEIMREIDEKYVDSDKIVNENITYGLAKGLVYSLEDPYSSYLTPKESEDFEDDLNGNLEGIGAELNMQNDYVVVVSPLRDSPAARAGILPQDVIIKVDDQDVAGLNLVQVVSKIRGKPGTKVKITVLRKNEQSALDFEITREKITVESVDLEMKGDIAVLTISQFGTNTKEEFERHLSEAILANAKGIILDLRFNPGGYLDKARDVVSAFIADGKVVITQSRGGKEEPLYVSGNKKTDLPLVIIQNKGSASASEIVAGALQDAGRATIIGESSFGKGKVQEVIPLKNGGKLRITISSWLTPKGRSINEKGIEPDIIIKNTPEDYQEGRDPQLDKALETIEEKIKAER